jgi:CheY-like chemotaxis protein
MSTLKILIADDDPTPRRFLQAALHKLQHDRVMAVDGREAWEAYQATQAGWGGGAARACGAMAGTD